jgi:hypothetical protein
VLTENGLLLPAMITRHVCGTRQLVNLSTRPEGAGSYDRQFQADLTALRAHILLQHLTPAEALVITAELLGHPLFSDEAQWRERAKRGEFLIKKTLEGQLTGVLLSEWLERLGHVKGSTQFE